MFTGIVERVGSVRDVIRTDDGVRMEISVSDLGDIPIGASIAVNGVCLTAVGTDGELVTVDVVPETLQRTNLGSLGSGGQVNLERAMAASGRFDGHIVQGHVDGTGVVAGIDRAGEAVTMTVAVGDDLQRYLVEKGSITIDGVSLTIAALGEGSFQVALIPHTLEVTTLGLRNAGDEVNLEVDVLSKYVERLLEYRS